MVELKGSEKQVAWGNEIREVVLSYLNRALKMLLEEIEEEGERKGRTVEERKQIHINKFNKALDEIVNNENADFYIKTFKHIEKYNDSFSLATKLQEMGVKSPIIHYLQKINFDDCIFKDETYDEVNEIPGLKGTEKQIKWANEIRDRFLKIVEIFEDATNNLESSVYDDEIQDTKRNIKVILSDDRASFYIEKLKKLNDDMIEKSSARTYKEKITDTLVLTNSVLNRY